MTESFQPPVLDFNQMPAVPVLPAEQNPLGLNKPQNFEGVNQALKVTVPEVAPVTAAPAVEFKVAAPTVQEARESELMQASQIAAKIAVSNFTGWNQETQVSAAMANFDHKWHELLSEEDEKKKEKVNA